MPALRGDGGLHGRKTGLAEFAPAGANKIGLIFRGDMCLAKNPFRGAGCASEASAGSEAQSLLKSEPSEAGPI
jgi:hypothetical protein